MWFWRSTTKRNVVPRRSSIIGIARWANILFRDICMKIVVSLSIRISLPMKERKTRKNEDLARWWNVTEQTTAGVTDVQIRCIRGEKATDQFDSIGITENRLIVRQIQRAGTKITAFSTKILLQFIRCSKKKPIESDRRDETEIRYRKIVLTVEGNCRWRSLTKVSVSW